MPWCHVSASCRRYRIGPAARDVVSLAARLNRKAQPLPVQADYLSARQRRLQRPQGTVLERDDDNKARLEQLRRWCSACGGREVPSNRIAGVKVHIGELINVVHEDGGPGCVKVSIIHKHSCCLPSLPAQAI